MYDVTEARYVKDHTIWLRFEDESAGEVDLSPYLDGPVFEPLRDPAYIAKVAVNHEIGTVVWPNGADFSPEFLYDRVRVTTS